MVFRRLSTAVLATAALATPAHAAGLIKCKIDESRIVFHIQEVSDNKANVLIGETTSAASVKLVFKDVPTSQDGQVIIVDAWPKHMVATTERLKCADLKKFFHLELTPKAGGVGFDGDLGIYPFYNTLSDRAGPCQGFSAPEVQDDTFAKVVCVRSN